MNNSDDSNDVKFFDVETGEEIKTGVFKVTLGDIADDVSRAGTDIGKAMYNVGEEVAKHYNISYDFSHGEGYSELMSLTDMQIRSFTLTFEDVKISGEVLAHMMGLNKVEPIRKLIYLHNRTKKRRVKNKLNNRILEEINNY